MNIGKIFNFKKESVKCFYEESRNQNHLLPIDRGIKVVDINKIVGSVGRCMEFTADFSLRSKHKKQHILR